MNDRSLLQQALEALENGDVPKPENVGKNLDAITAIKEALAQPEQEPAMWLLTDKNINSIQVDSIQRLINRLKHAHHTDIRVRINGHDEWFEADWLKHMVRVTPPQRTWVDLTDKEIEQLHTAWVLGGGFRQLCNAVESKLKEKNT